MVEILEFKCKREVQSFAELERIIEELNELRKPHRVCVCGDAVPGRFLENRFTHECRVCRGVMPLKWAYGNGGAGPGHI